MQLTDIADLGPAEIGALDSLRVGDHARHQASDLVGFREDRDAVARRLAHLARSVDAEHDRSIGEDRLRLGEDRSVASVEGAHDLARQFQVRRLVLADRHPAGLVDHDVGRLQDGVVEQPHAVLDAVLALLLVGWRAFHPADRHDRVEDPRQLGVLGKVRLTDQRAAVGVEADGEQIKHHLVRQPPHLRTVVDGGHGVVVDNAVDRLVPVLERDVVELRAEVVAQVRGAGGLDPAEDALTDGRLAHRRASVARALVGGPPRRDARPQAA